MVSEYAVLEIGSCCEIKISARFWPTIMTDTKYLNQLPDTFISFSHWTGKYKLL